MAVLDNLKSSNSNVMYNEETDNLDFYINGEMKYSKYMGVKTNGFLIYDIGRRYVALDWTSFYYEGLTTREPVFTESEICFQNDTDTHMYFIGTNAPIDITNYTKFCVTTNIGTIVVDISNLNGMQYLGFRTWKGGSNNVLNAFLVSSKGNTKTVTKQSQLTIDSLYNHCVFKMWLE